MNTMIADLKLIPDSSGNIVAIEWYDGEDMNVSEDGQARPQRWILRDTEQLLPTNVSHASWIARNLVKVRATDADVVEYTTKDGIHHYGVWADGS